MARLRLVALTLSGLAVLAATWALAADEETPVSVKVLVEPGGRVDWCPGNNLIAFDRKAANGYYAIYTCRPNGTDVQPVTEGVAGLPGRDVGQPAWSPDGKYLVFQAEKATHDPVSRFSTSPGAGMLNDLWVLDMKTRRARPLRVVPDSQDSGVLHPHFSADGTKLSWTEMYVAPRPGREFGWWWLMVADVEKGSEGLKISNFRKFQPSGPGFYENHGFSPDGKKLIYTTNSMVSGAPAYEREDICVYDLALDRPIRLTSADYNEHAQFSPDGKRIVWMSNAGNAPERQGAYELTGTDYWIMDADGSNKQRLTNFNVPDSPMYRGTALIVGDLSWSPDGKAFVGYCHTGLFSTEEGVVEQVLLVTFEADQ